MADKNSIIYLDNNATTMPAPEALAAAEPWLRDNFANPSSGYAMAREARAAVEKAREQVAVSFGCDPVEVVFTSGGSEANSTAIHSALETMLERDPERDRIVTTKVEHPSVLETLRWYGETHGLEVVELGVTQRGMPRAGQWQKELSNPRNALVCILAGNNETGAWLAPYEHAFLAERQGAWVHVDMVHWAKLGSNVLLGPEDVPPFHSASFSAHKFHGLKGAGFLFVRRGLPFTPLVMGGHQERGRRAGTENVAAIVAMGAAAALRTRREQIDLSVLNTTLEEGLLAVGKAHVNGPSSDMRMSTTVNISFLGVDARDLLKRLDELGVCASAGSACTTGSPEPSHVLRAMGLNEERCRSAVRFSLSRYTTKEEIDEAVKRITQAVGELRERNR